MNFDSSLRVIMAFAYQWRSQKFRSRRSQKSRWAIAHHLATLLIPIDANKMRTVYGQTSKYRIFCPGYDYE